jgi:hypothetical protein
VVTDAPSAELLRADGTSLGHTPIELDAPSGEPVRYLLRAPGYRDEPVIIGADAPGELRVTAHKLTPPSAPRRPAAATSSSTPAGGISKDW